MMIVREEAGSPSPATHVLGGIVFACLLFISCASAGFAQNSNTGGDPAAHTSPSPTPVQTPIPLAVVVSESDRAVASSKDAEAFIRGQLVPYTIVEGIPSVRAEIEELRLSSRGYAADGRTLESIAAAERDWQALKNRVGGWISRIQSQAGEIEERISDLKTLSERWKATADAYDAARTAGTGDSVDAVPEELVRRTDTVLAAIADAERRAVGKRAEFLLIESRLSELQSEIDTMLSALKQQREQQLVNIFSRNAPPIWAADGAGLAPGVVSAAVSGSLTEQWKGLEEYASRNSGRFVLHGALLLLLIAVLVWAKKRTAPFAEDDPRLQRPAAFFKLPLASALVISALFSGFIHPQSPKLLNTIIAAAAIIPGFLILRRIVESPFHYLLYGLLGLFMLDRARDLLIDAPLASRIVFSLEMLAAGLLLTWFYTSRRVAANVEAGTFASYRRVRALIPAGVIVFLTSFGANLLGFVSLAYLAGNGLLRAAYLSIFLYVAVQILASSIAFLLRVAPFNRSRAVQHNRSLIRQRASRVLTWIAVFVWVVGVLNVFSISDAVYAAVGAVLGHRFAIGEITFSFGDIVLFVVVVWAAVLVSRFVRFVLEEDVYPRLNIGGGASFAVSSVFHYLLLIAAFFFAISAVGFELSRFAIVAGAVGLGLGFGLQNIINNFVSGLILLFEQPVKVGDTVQIGLHTGSLRSIGLRASVVRKVDGSDVIVPNSQLISQEVINWTMLDERRRIDIPVGVAYGSDPRKVSELLIGIASKYDEILAEPAPKALFIGLGESSLDFELRVWTDDTDGWVGLRSSLVTDVYDRLNEAGIEIPYPQRDVHLKTGGGSVE